MKVMRFGWMTFLPLAAVLQAPLVCQTSASNPPPKNSPVPHSESAEDTSSASRSTEVARPGEPATTQDASPNDSSSRTYVLDLSPPAGDFGNSDSSSATADATGVNELHPWNPHRAQKDVEVGDYYFKEKNYRGAEGRYRDALLYKPNDASATFRLAQLLEKTDRTCEARTYYASYLKILPHGPNAEDSRRALARIPAPKAPCPEKPEGVGRKSLPLAEAAH